MVRPKAKLCQVCTAVEAKYKCPGCRAPYCSAACYKTHKETPCAPAPATPADAASAAQQRHPPAAPAAAQPPSLSARQAADDEVEVDPAQLLSAAQLAALRSTPSVLQALEDPVIRAQLTKIESSSNRTKELQKALLDPSFAGFMYQTLDGLAAKQ